MDGNEMAVLQSFDGIEVGDELTIRPDMEGCTYYGAIYATSSMAEARGTVVRVWEKERDDVVMVTSEILHNDDFYWSPQMFLDKDAPTPDYTGVSFAMETLLD